MTLSQTGLWEFVNTQIQVSSIKRVNWREVLGMTLTEYITNLKTLYELNPEQVFNHIVGVLQRRSLDTEDNVRRVRISVASRFAEQNIMKKRLERS